MEKKTNESPNIVAQYDEFFGMILVEEVQIIDSLQMHASMDGQMLALKSIDSALRQLENY